MNKLDELILNQEILSTGVARDTAAALRLLRDAVNDLAWIDAMPVDGCSPFVIEDMLRQAKVRAHTRLTALTTARQQGAGRVPLSKTLDRWDSEDLTARLAAAERVVEAARKVKDRLDPDMHERDIRSCRDDLLVALAAYPPTTQTEVKG